MKRIAGYLLGLFIMYSILDGAYYLISGQSKQTFLWFLIILGTGLTIDFIIKGYTGENYWTLRDIYNKIKHK